ncbi:MAG: DUF418 domain-containing protein [Parabacteroides merdae]
MCWSLVLSSCGNKFRPIKCYFDLVPYGKMSLTNCLTQSIIGSFIYF